MSTRLTTIVICATLLVGCGGSSTPTAPTPPAPPVFTVTPQPTFVDRSTPAVTGQWFGTYTVTSCQESASLVGSGACATLGRGGSTRLTPTQSGTTIGGTLGIGDANIPVSGSVDLNGVVTLAGSATIDGVTVTLNTWRGTIIGSDMNGTFTFTVIHGGSVQVQASFRLSK